MSVCIALARTQLSVTILGDCHLEVVEVHHTFIRYGLAISVGIAVLGVGYPFVLAFCSDRVSSGWADVAGTALLVLTLGALVTGVFDLDLVIWRSVCSPLSHCSSC